MAYLIRQLFLLAGGITVCAAKREPVADGNSVKLRGTSSVEVNHRPSPLDLPSFHF
jgi:hypothetical protein